MIKPAMTTMTGREEKKYTPMHAGKNKRNKKKGVGVKPGTQKKTEALFKLMIYDSKNFCVDTVTTCE